MRTLVPSIYTHYAMSQSSMRVSWCEPSSLDILRAGLSVMAAFLYSSSNLFASSTYKYVFFIHTSSTYTYVFFIHTFGR